MTKSATDLMQDILFAAVIDAIAAMKAASKGLSNNLIRDLNAVHANTTLVDLPTDVQAAIQANVRAAFTRLQREGYVVAPASTGPSPSPKPLGKESVGRGPRSGPYNGRREPSDRTAPRPERAPRRDDRPSG